MSQGVLRGQGFVDVVNNNTKMVDKEQGWQADKVQDISGRRHHKHHSLIAPSSVSF